MKRFCKLLLATAAVLLLTAVVSVCAAALSGDVNADGNVNLQDVLMLRKYLASISLVKSSLVGPSPPVSITISLLYLKQYLYVFLLR